MIIWRYLVIITCFFLSKGSTSSLLCPRGCTCNNQNLTASCANANLDLIPHFLNPRIKSFDASGNRISRLELNFYVELRTLDLSSNQVEELRRSPFNGQRHLQYLNLSHNQISKLEAKPLSNGRHRGPFHGPNDLQTLDLSNNQLTVLKNHTFSSLRSLLLLILTSNQIRDLESLAFAGLDGLRTLNLESNRLTTLNSRWLEHLPSLRNLHLSDNQIVEISSDSLSPLGALQVLDLSRNLVSGISRSAFAGTRNLDTLDLSSNSLKKVPSSGLSEAVRLKFLDLSSNPIWSVDEDSFRNLQRLESLDLNNMDFLEKVSGLAFMRNRELRSLRLESNPNLHPLPYGIFESNPYLRSVSFVNNTGWSALSPHQLPSQRSLESLSISGIPFYCNCSILWLWDLYNTRNDTDVDLDQAGCANFDDLLAKVPAEQLVCSQLTTEAILVLVASIVLVLVCLLLIIVLALTIRHRRLKSARHIESPCMHLKDDTMIYRTGDFGGGGDLTAGGYHSLAATTSPPEYQKFYHQPQASNATNEPFYEVPKFPDGDGNTTSETEPKSSTSNSSKYSSSGYIGSELWDQAEYFSTTTLVSTLGPGHGFGTPGHYRSTLVHHPQFGKTLGSPGHHSGSSGVGSDSSNSTTASTKFKPVFFSPQPRHNTLVLGQGQGATRMIPQRDLMVMYNNGSGRPTQEVVTLGQYRQSKKPGRRSKSKEGGGGYGMPDVDLLASTVTSLHRRESVDPGANHYV